MQIVEHEDHDGKLSSLRTMHAGGVAQSERREFLAGKDDFVTPRLYDRDVLFWHSTDQRAGVPIKDIQAIVVLRDDDAVTHARRVLWEEVHTLSVRIEPLLQGAVQHLSLIHI